MRVRAPHSMGSTLVSAVIVSVNECYSTGCTPTGNGLGARITCPGAADGYLDAGTYVRLVTGDPANCTAPTRATTYWAQEHCFDDPSGAFSFKARFLVCSDVPLS